MKKKGDNEEKWRTNARMNVWTWELEWLNRWREWSCTEGEQCITKKGKEKKEGDVKGWKKSKGTENWSREKESKKKGFEM